MGDVFVSFSSTLGEASCSERKIVNIGNVKAFRTKSESFSLTLPEVCKAKGDVFHAAVRDSEHCAMYELSCQQDASGSFSLSVVEDEANRVEPDCGPCDQMFTCTASPAKVRTSKPSFSPSTQKPSLAPTNTPPRELSPAPTPCPSPKMKESLSATKPPTPVKLNFWMPNDLIAFALFITALLFFVILFVALRVRRKSGARARGPGFVELSQLDLDVVDDDSDFEDGEGGISSNGVSNVDDMDDTAIAEL